MANKEYSIGKASKTLFSMIILLSIIFISGLVSAQSSPASVGDDPVMGQENAPVTIVKYTDFGCPFCKRWAQNTLPQIEDNYIDSGHVKVVYKDAPIPELHPEAPEAHAAANCVYDNEGEDAFFEFADKLYGEQNTGGEWGNPDFVGWASDAGYDIESCLSNNDYQDEIDEDKQEAQAAGLQGTPHFVVKASDSDTGTAVQGAQPYSAFEQVIKDKIPGSPSEEDSGNEDTQEDFISNEEIGVKDDPVLGEPDAPLTLIKYADFGCPFCKRWHQNSLPKIETNYVDQGVLKIVYKDSPISELHPGAPEAHAAANCVYDNEGEDAFFEFSGKLYSNQNQFADSEGNEDILIDLASEEGYDIESCMSSNDYQNEIEEDNQEAQAAGLEGTPHFVLTEEGPRASLSTIQGARPYEDFEQKIEKFIRNGDYDYEEPSVENSDNSEDSSSNSCNGCVVNGNCVPIGHRVEDEGESKFCTVSGNLEAQKDKGDSCQNNYECSTNRCSSGECISVRDEVEENQGILESITKFFENLFG